MSSRNDKSLVTLVRIKDMEERAAAEQLNAARDRLDKERKNLTTVQQYLSEYSISTGSGSTRSRLLVERQRFRLQLGRTVEAQQAAVEHARGQAEAARAQWAAVRSEREAMSRLADRRRDADQRRELAVEQKQTDEQAQLAGTRRSGDR